MRRAGGGGQAGVRLRDLGAPWQVGCWRARLGSSLRAERPSADADLAAEDPEHLVEEAGNEHEGLPDVLAWQRAFAGLVKLKVAAVIAGTPVASLW